MEQLAGQGRSVYEGRAQMRGDFVTGYWSSIECLRVGTDLHWYIYAMQRIVGGQTPGLLTRLMLRQFPYHS